MREKEELEVDEHGKQATSRVMLEEKMINGCGPYRYLRFWSGRKHRYLGKTQPDGKE